jgi:hypothetical protein
VRGERLLEGQIPTLHPAHELLELIERTFECESSEGWAVRNES